MNIVKLASIAVLGLGTAIAVSACGSSPPEKTSQAAAQALSSADCDANGENCTCPDACVCVGEHCYTCSCDLVQCATRKCQGTGGNTAYATEPIKSLKAE